MSHFSFLCFFLNLGIFVCSALQIGPGQRKSLFFQHDDDQYEHHNNLIQSACDVCPEVGRKTNQPKKKTQQFSLSFSLFRVHNGAPLLSVLLSYAVKELPWSFKALVESPCLRHQNGYGSGGFFFAQTALICMLKIYAETLGNQHFVPFIYEFFLLWFSARQLHVCSLYVHFLPK